MRKIRTPSLLCIAAIAIAASPAAAEGAAEAESLVRALYYEGLPAEAARGLDGEGVARLGEMLADPAEAEHHGNIVSALGHSGHPAAFDLLRAYAAATPSGETDRATFRARTRLGQAFGHLARRDTRALQWLLASARRGAGDPGWSFRRYRGAALRAVLDEQILTGLALSGAPAARPWIEAAAAAPGRDRSVERRRAHGRFALELHARMAGRAAPGRGEGAP